MGLLIEENLMQNESMNLYIPLYLIKSRSESVLALFSFPADESEMSSAEAIQYHEGIVKLHHSITERCNVAETCDVAGYFPPFLYFDL